MDDEDWIRENIGKHIDQKQKTLNLTLDELAYQADIDRKLLVKIKMAMYLLIRSHS